MAGFYLGCKRVCVGVGWGGGTSVLQCMPAIQIMIVFSCIYCLYIYRIVQKAIIKKGFSKNTWNKVKLQNRYRARWAKGKTGIGLDEHRATHA